MTRRGSLVYYLAAWAVGCFAITLMLWVKDLIALGSAAFARNISFELIGLYFYSCLCGAFVTLFGAFVLRRIMATVKSPTAVHWIVTGAIVAAVSVEGFSRVGNYLEPLVSRRHGGIEAASFLLFLGAQAIVDRGWWLVIPAGAMTAYVLYRIDRVFQPRVEEADANA
jgi:hypothetical protein